MLKIDVGLEWFINTRTHAYIAWFGHVQACHLASMNVLMQACHSACNLVIMHELLQEFGHTFKFLYLVIFLNG